MIRFPILALLLASPVHGGPNTELRLSGPVAEESASALILALKSAKGLPVRLSIDSPGGSVVAGLELIKAIEAHGQVDCVVDGTAASMAFFVLQACRSRLMTPDSLLMTHPPSIQTSEALTAAKLREYLSMLSALQAALEWHGCHRLVIPPEDCQKRSSATWWMAADEALDVGAVDEVTK